MFQKKQKPSMNDRLTDMESYLDKVTDTLEKILLRLESIEKNIEKITHDNIQLKSEVKYIKPRLGLPV